MLDKTQAEAPEENTGVATLPTAETQPEAAVTEEAPKVATGGERLAKKRKKKRRKAPFIVGGILLLLGGALAYWLFFGEQAEPEGEVLTDFVTRGSITTMVEGNGIAKPLAGETVSIATSGTVLEVLVTEGDSVTAGTALYRVDSPTADEAVEAARNSVESYREQLNDLYETIEKLEVRTPFAGKLLDCVALQEGAHVAGGTVLARLVDDNTMTLAQYYSYAYAQEIALGMAVEVSVPAVMQNLPGTVSDIKMVERISSEGSKLFLVEVSVPNPGVLVEEMMASAVIMGSDGAMITPYEQGTLDYSRSTEIVAEVSGDLTLNQLENYLKVDAGEIVLRVSGDDSSDSIRSTQESLNAAEDALETALEAAASLSGVAPIDGIVTSVGIAAGDEITAGTAAVSVEDSSQILVEASIDERSLGFIEAGMMAEIDQWGAITSGIVESVSLTGSFENGMTTFPARIVVENAEGMLTANSSVIYRIEASQSLDTLTLPTQCVKSVADPETGEPMQVVFLRSDSPPMDSLAIDGSELGVPPEGFYAVPVVIGISDQFSVEILSGLEEGMEVFTQVIMHNTWDM